MKIDTNTTTNSVIEDNSINNCVIKVSNILHWFFNFHSQFKGTITEIAINRNIKVCYSDADQEIMITDEFNICKE